MVVGGATVVTGTTVDPAPAPAPAMVVGGATVLGLIGNTVTTETVTKCTYRIGAASKTNAVEAAQKSCTNNNQDPKPIRIDTVHTITSVEREEPWY